MLCNAGGADLREAIRRSLDTPSVMVEEPLMVERKSARGSRQLTNGRTAAHGPNTNRNATSASQADVSDRSGNALGVSGRSRHFAEAGPVQLAKPQLPHMCACGKSFRNALGLGGHKATCKASVVRKSMLRILLLRWKVSRWQYWCALLNTVCACIPADNE